MSPTISISPVFRAPAKINVGLEVLERRPDGYHDIQSIFLAVDLCDDIEIDPLDEDIVLTCEPSMTTTPHDNLVFKAADLLKRHCGNRNWGAKITLRKNIPAGAGLGGGSSDAATVLSTLNTMWSAGLATVDLLTLSGSLGSDVPFFIQPRPSLVTGRGEFLQPLRCLPQWDVVLVVPEIHVNTAWAYQTLQRVGRRTPTNLVQSFTEFVETGNAPEASLINDFEAVVAAEYPELRDIRSKLESLSPLFVSMSGSGSAMYALFRRGTAPPSIGDIFAPTFAVTCHTL